MADASFTGTVVIDGEPTFYSVCRSKKRKRTIAFKFVRGNTLRVLAPFRASQGVIESILYRRADWISRERSRRMTDSGKAPYTDGAAFSYLGFPCTVRITQGALAPRSCALLPRRFVVHVPEELSPDGLRDEVRLELLLWIKKRARTKFKARLDFWAQRLGVSYKKMIVANQGARWGSCSADDVIRLNWKLMMAPLRVVDYVVAHELSHVRHKNHSVRFWSFLARAMPDCELRRSELRTLERRLDF